jgi:hypothetical protein
MPIENHTATIYDRGGMRPLFELKKLSSVKWGRERDDMSSAQLTLSSNEVSRQAENLNQIDPGRHELVVFRDGVRQWEGPCNIPTQTGEIFSLTANDTLHYYNRRVMHARYSSASPNVEYVVRRFERIARAELARKEALGYNLLSYLNVYQDADDAKTSTVTEAWQATVYGHLESLAAKSGIDYTMVGRALHVWDTSKPKLGTTPVVSQKDFRGKITVAKYGAELATRTIVTDGQGAAGQAGGEDPYYGEVELLATAYDEETDDVLPTLDELIAQAKRNLRGRMPTPLTVRVPENSSIDPRGVFKPEFWVPGIYVPLRGVFGSAPVTQMQKLQNVTVTEGPDGETVQVSLYPATSADDGTSPGAS